ncbi:AAC(3) family N-acetyltransferase [Thermophagus xiamenensis]|uniref:Aminoglycoside N(3)-acetyltransferase n=1 Tax=Thermophagus xiamenensis TaxID=385682 RepID=A0A1I2E3U3_9BACT|nr:AAC(3) family N-acetyltransferase [Thermophagus xiamenensis]SFE87333.1 Aminoglycoside N3'-acetyltransferase [Thermophagus xiamenensis]
MMWTKKDLVSDLKKGGIPKGALLHLKVSIRAIGKIDGGAETLLEALLDTVGPEGTLVIDSFVTSYPLPLSKKHARQISTPKTASYAGALANVMIRHPLMVRSKHPIQRFTAIGKLAHELMDNHTPESGGYDVLERMARMGALNLSVGRNTIGVGTTHVAIEKLGFTKKNPPKGVNYLDEEGNIKLFKVNWNGGCARGFPKFIPLYEQAGCLKWIKVGNADAALTDMAGTLAVEMKKLKEDPSFFFCDDPTCKDCRLRWEHSTGNYFKVKYYSFLKIVRGNFLNMK